MPELPEVESFRRYFNATSLHQRISGVEVLGADLLKDVSAKELASRLKGHRFKSTRRHGKHLFARVDDHLWLRLHFGMTGSLHYVKAGEEAPPYTRVLFAFAKDRRLAFQDSRKFGEVGLVRQIDEFVKTRALGPDALAVDLSAFRNMLGKHRGIVKPLLMNQRLIAGIGNIYADEILFQARIHPATPIAQLTDKSVKALFDAMHRVLTKAIECDADWHRVPHSWLLPRRGKGANCPRCGHKLRSAKLGGRTAWFCALCQKAPR